MVFADLFLSQVSLHRALQLTKYFYTHLTFQLNTWNRTQIKRKLFLINYDVAAKLLQSCPTLRPHRRQPTRLPRPRGSPGRNTGVGCHFLLQFMRLKSETEVSRIKNMKFGVGLAGF